MKLIKNLEKLISNGGTLKNKKGRELVLKTMEEAIKSVLPRNLIKKNIIIKDQTLIIGNNYINIDLNKVSNIYLIGGGKASKEMALGLLDILNDRINAGVINIPRGSQTNDLTDKKIKFIETGHPIPTKEGMNGVLKMLEIVEKAKSDDLIFCLISGGGSALMPLPANGITINDLKIMNKILLGAGMPINEINVLRKHCSKVKGGQLVMKNKAMFITLIISDVLNDPLDIIASGPSVPDESTFFEAMNIIKKYNLENKLPKSILNFIKDGLDGKALETPKKSDLIFKNVKNYVLGNLNIACESALNYAKKYGIPCKRISSSIEGEASQVGINLINELSLNKRPIVLIGGGETTVTLKGRGKGGRNQELILSAIRKIENEGIIIGAIGTDGIDGNSDAAGAIADSSIAEKAKISSLDINKFLINNDSYNFFKKIGDGLIFTGYTGTNVNDLYILVAL